MAILLSVKPQHLANILNGKKTIEIMKVEEFK
jgi:predicted transcriptional regulator